MELSEIIPHIEALIFASDKPLTSLEVVELINNAFGFMEHQITLDQVESSLDGIREKYNAEFYPFEVLQSGGGWQFLTKASFHMTIAQLNSGKFLKKLSNSSLETLSIIAYKQPITKGEIESIRGVNSDYSVQKLLEKELIIISGRNEELPGKPLIYETSKGFMDYFGLNSPDDLPKIKEVLAEHMVEPTAQDRTVEQNGEFDIFSEQNRPESTPSLSSTEEKSANLQTSEEQEVSTLSFIDGNDSAFNLETPNKEEIDFDKETLTEDYSTEKEINEQLATAETFDITAQSDSPIEDLDDFALPEQNEAIQSDNEEAETFEEGHNQPIDYSEQNNEDEQ